LPGSEAMLLSLNTCGSTASVALALTGAQEIQILATASLAARTYSAHLIPEIAAMLANQHATLGDIEAIVVVNGPGSFTGIRVGLSTAKGLAEGTGIPLIAVSRLALLAASSGLPHVIAAIDAGRGEYYVGEYQNGNNLGEVLLTGEETVALAKQPGAGVLVCDESVAGDAGTPATSACAALAICGPVYVQPADAAEALRFALGRFHEGKFDDPETLQANYLRRSDAEVFRSAKAGAAT
jgi:tRNA threonylcarbamoyladenosine biosynthesis protein TsaB